MSIKTKNELYTAFMEWVWRPIIDEFNIRRADRVGPSEEFYEGAVVGFDGEWDALRKRLIIVDDLYNRFLDARVPFRVHDHKAFIGFPDIHIDNISQEKLEEWFIWWNTEHNLGPVITIEGEEDVS